MEAEVAKDIPAIDHEAIIQTANEYLIHDVITITSFVAERSAGKLHDYYSEGRYWWPDDDNPDGPYIRRDGIANPQNFTGHQDALRDLSKIVTALTAAYEITGEEKYALRAIAHFKAWFVTPATRMNPHLLYGQAIKGITTGRGIGIIDTLRFINVALSVKLLEKAGLLKGRDLTSVKNWFGEYGDWLTNHPYGIKERDNNNNHSTWWGAQVAAFALAADRPDLAKIAEEQFRIQLPIQVATDGSLLEELRRTRPFHYMNYTLEAWATYAELLSLDGQNFWNYTAESTRAPYGKEQREATGTENSTTSGKSVSLQDAMNYALPYLKDPSSWPHKTELEKGLRFYRNDFLVFAWWGLDNKEYLELWQKLDTVADEDNDGLNANLVLWEKIKSNQYDE